MSLFNSILNILRNLSVRGEDLLNNLPPEIMIEILSRLPVVTILSCKRVCKSWRDLVKRPDFATSHLSKQTCVAIKQHSHKIFRFVGEQFAAESLLVSCNWPNPNKPILYCSANGLLFLLEKSSLSDIIFICNPITREYIELDLPPPRGPLPYTRVFGFGVTRISGKNKIVRIISSISKLTGYPTTCRVYTLGTGHWRSVGIAACCRLVEYKYNPAGVFLNGNLHWLVFDSHGNPCVSCMDLETELFTSFSPPLDFPHDNFNSTHLSLSALGDHLCLYANSDADGVVIWLMKEYGDDKSWTKEFIFKKLPHHTFIIKLCYSPFNNLVSYTPSFVSLKILEMENVVSF